MSTIEATTTTRPVPDHAAQITVREAESLFVREAELLDRWQLTEWLELLTDDARYLVPPLDRPDADPADTLFLIADSRRVIQSRVEQLLGKTTWAENPRSRTRRLVTNFRIVVPGAESATVAANFAVWHFQNDTHHTFIGHYEYKVVRDGDALRIRERKAVLDLQALRPHGKLSFLL